MAERKWTIKLTKYTPYLALTGELWGVFCEDFGEYWPRYNGTALYIDNLILPNPSPVSSAPGDVWWQLQQWRHVCDIRRCVQQLRVQLWQ